MVPSPPIVVTEPGTVIEQVRITSDAHAAIRVMGAADVTIRSVDITMHGPGPGIHVSDAPRLRIEHVAIESRMATPTYAHEGIVIDRSQDVVISDVRIRGTRSGIVLDSSDRGRLSAIEGHDMRGGDFLELVLSGATTVVDFSSENSLDANVAYPFSLIAVRRSLDVTIARGLLDGLNSPTGHGINFILDESGLIDGLVEDVDAVHMTNGAFAAWSANGVTFRRTRARDNFCDNADELFQGEPASGGTSWAHPASATDIRIEASAWFNLCKVPPQFPADEGAHAALELENLDFTPRAPVRVEFCWE